MAAAADRPTHESGVSMKCVATVRPVAILLARKHSTPKPTAQHGRIAVVMSRTTCLLRRGQWR